MRAKCNIREFLLWLASATKNSATVVYSVELSPTGMHAEFATGIFSQDSETTSACSTGVLYI